jgi:glycosyltransferase involved in cell wall biosynthesis
LYSAVKMAVIPLRFGAGVKGKTVEAMFHGIPIVSTSFGIEGMPGNYNDFLQPFDDHIAFASAVIALYTNNKTLEKMSEQETSYINAHFTQQAAATQFKRLLNL